MKLMIWILLSLHAALTASFINEAANAGPVGPAAASIEYPYFYRISDEFGNQRAQTDLREGPCVVLLKKPRERRLIGRRGLERILGQTGLILEHPDSNNPAVNCHSFACVQAGIMLPEDAWLNADLGYLRLLREYFQNTGLHFDERSASSFAFDRSIWPGDLVLFLRDSSIQHSGIVVQRYGQNRVLSKLDEDMIVETPIKNLFNPYFVDSAKIFRRR